MASGYFPLHPKYDDWGTELARAAKAIKHVREEWHESRGGMNPEDAAQDQSYVDGLYAAEAAINECFRVDESDLAAVEEQIRQAELRQDDAEREGDRWRAIAARLKAKAILDDAAKSAVGQ